MHTVTMSVLHGVHGATQNHLLAALPLAEYAALTACTEPVSLLPGERLYEADKPLQYAYFPTTSMVSLHYVTASGGSAETAGIGNEGMVGVALCMGSDTTPGLAIVQGAGGALRLERQRFMQLFERSGALRRLLLRHTYAVMIQMAQTALCNRHHSLEQQLCRWLLLTLDRAPESELIVTQELVAGMLGVPPDALDAATDHLQCAGAIRYRYGSIAVTERRLLERHVCECYTVVSRELDRLRSDLSRRQVFNA